MPSSLPLLLPPTLGEWKPANPGRAMAVLMSGGVDSSIAALLLKREGWDAVGVTMRLPSAQGCSHPRPCCGWEAAGVCKALGIPHFFIDANAAFSACVIDPFRQAYAEGRTPSPCVDCNTSLKFGQVWDVLDAAWPGVRVATGHYAMIVDSGGGFRLMRAGDPRRDQSYFLYGIRRERLARLHFPLGAWRKEDVRALAREAALPTAHRQDSMDLCFAGEGDYRNALGLDGVDLSGSIEDAQGRVLGQHPGIQYFTPGQRHGMKVAAKHPLYVLRIDVPRRAVIVGPKDEALASVVEAGGANVLVPEAVAEGALAFGRVRSSGEPAACLVERSGGGALRVRFAEPVFSPAPGQHLVLYNEEGCVLAGGVIDNASR